MLKAFVLIETSTGTSPRLVSLLKATQEVQSVYRVTGPHDIIAIIEVADLEALGTWLADKVHPLPGVQKTVTCVAVSQ